MATDRPLPPLPALPAKRAPLPAAPRSFQPVFAPATKEGTKLRCALMGSPGSGKTFTALRIATGMVAERGGRIAMIDSERRTARKYADRFMFDVCDQACTAIADYIASLELAASAGYDVVIVDSITHAWEAVLEAVDNAAEARYRGNSFAAWREGTPLQRRFIDALFNHPAHILCTIRQDIAYEVVNEGGRVKPVRVGTKPRQGKEIEYEFDLLIQMSSAHAGEVLKDRTGRFQDEIIRRPGEEFGQQLRAWLEDRLPDQKPFDGEAVEAEASTKYSTPQQTPSYRY